MLNKKEYVLLIRCIHSSSINNRDRIKALSIIKSLKEVNVN